MVTKWLINLGSTCQHRIRKTITLKAFVWLVLRCQFLTNFFQHSCAHMVLPCFSFLFPHLVERLTENHMFDALSVITVIELVARRYTLIYIFFIIKWMHQTIQRLCVCINILFLFLPFFFFGFFLTPQEIFTGFIESLVLAWLLNNITYLFYWFFLKY
jgi:hypothetical protein